MAVLISNRLDFDVIARMDDPNENYMVIKIRIKKEVFILGAVYGPNKLDANFYAKLRTDITVLRGGTYFPVILGGGLEYNLGPAQCFNKHRYISDGLGTQSPKW